MDSGFELITSRSERDISEPVKEITLVHSAPEVTLKSILKSANNTQMEDKSGPPNDRKGFVQWHPQVEVIYYAGDSVVDVAKENLSQEVDQLARKAAYASANTRIRPNLDQTPFLEEMDLDMP